MYLLNILYMDLNKLVIQQFFIYSFIVGNVGYLGFMFLDICVVEILVVSEELDGCFLLVC